MVVLVCLFVLAVVPKGSRIRVLYGSSYLGLPIILVAVIFSKWVVPLVSAHISGATFPLVVAAIAISAFFTYFVNRPNMFSSGIFFLCPEATAYLVVNQLTKDLRVIEQGFNFKYHWELVEEGNKFDLGIRIGEPYIKQGETEEGGILDVSLRLSWRPDTRSSKALATYNSLGNQKEAEKKVRESLDEEAGKAVLAVMYRYSLTSFRSAADEINREISQALKIGQPETSRTEEECGIELVLSVVGDISPQKGSATERALGLKARIAIYAASVVILQKANPGMTAEDALNFIAVSDADARAFKVSGDGKGLIFAPEQMGSAKGGNP